MSIGFIWYLSLYDRSRVKQKYILTLTLSGLKQNLLEPRKAIIFGFLHLQKNDHIGRFRRQAEEENSIEWRNKGKND